MASCRISFLRPQRWSVSKKQTPEPVVEALAIAVPPERAWEALTGSKVIGDIVMGHVEMDSRPGKPFAWHWGVWEKCSPKKGGHAWSGTILDVVPGSTLVLSGSGSTTVLTVKGEGEASLVTVVHAAPAGSTEDFRYGWADFLLKLKTLLERRPASSQTYLRTLVRATPVEVLRAWLSPTVMSKILPGKVKVQAKRGGRFEWTWKHTGQKDSGHFLEIEKGHRVAFSWEGTAPPSEVRFSAERTPYGALVSLEHIGFVPARGLVERRWAHLLERLRAYFYYGKKIRTS